MTREQRPFHLWTLKWGKFPCWSDTQGLGIFKTPHGFAMHVCSACVSFCSCSTGRRLWELHCQTKYNTEGWVKGQWHYSFLLRDDALELHECAWATNTCSYKPPREWQRSTLYQTKQITSFIHFDCFESRHISRLVLIKSSRKRNFACNFRDVLFQKIDRLHGGFVCLEIIISGNLVVYFPCN